MLKKKKVSGEKRRVEAEETSPISDLMGKSGRQKKSAGEDQYLSRRGIEILSVTKGEMVLNLLVCKYNQNS